MYSCSIIVHALFLIINIFSLCIQLIQNNYCKIIWNRPTLDLTWPTVIYGSVSKSNSTCICSICLIFTDHKPLPPRYHSFLNIIFVKSVDTSFEILSRKILMRNLLQIYTNTCNNGCFFITHSFKYIFPIILYVRWYKLSALKLRY